MSVSRRPAPRASRPFVTTPYKVVDGQLRPVLPARGPCWSEAAPCRTRIQHLRRRKTGIPWGFVAVAICVTHGLSFTLYPPGHVPYGREPWVALGPDGSDLDSGTGANKGPTSSGYFGAANDAADGSRWPVDSAPSPPDAVRTTQRRRVAKAAALLGLEGDLSLGPETVADVTGLPAGELLEALGRLAITRDLVRRGREIRDVLAHVAGRAGRALMDRFAVLGHLVGEWGPPYRWRPRFFALLELGRPFWRQGPHGMSALYPTLPAAEPVYDFGPGHPP